MKKKFLSIIFLSMVVGLNAQTKITGFGKLKLGSPVTIINELGYNKIEPISKSDDYFRKVYGNTSGTKIYELIADSTQEYQVQGSSLDPRVKVYFVPKYSVTDNIEIKSVKLKFFNDSLIEIFCDGNSKLEEALTIKYGEPKKDLKEKEKTYTYTYTGAKVTKTDQTFTSEWQTNDKNITCRRVLMKYYNDEGKENYISYVRLANTSHDNDISKVENLIKERIKNRKLLEKKKALSGF